MEWAFWVCVGFILYTYAGYPLWLLACTRLRPRPVCKAEVTPHVSFIVAARNEAANLPAKIENLLSVDYAADRLEVIVASDGSTDATNAILGQWSDPRVRAVILEEHQGKAVALNHAVAAARGDILVFTDARQKIEPGAVKQLVANLADPAVGAVSGELMIGDGSAVTGAGLYWNIEKKIRQWESQTGSVVGATGALYAVRRELATPFPAGAILDDVYLPKQVARQGRRVVFEPQARVWDPWVTTSREEYRRKVRTLTGNYQLLQLAPWLLGPGNPLWFRLISHKLLRLAMPFALAALLVTSAVLVSTPVYAAAFVLQVLFYGSALLSAWWGGLGLVGRMAHVAWSFVMLNAAAMSALFHFLSGRRQVWVR